MCSRSFLDNKVASLLMSGIAVVLCSSATVQNRARLRLNIMPFPKRNMLQQAVYMCKKNAVHKLYCHDARTSADQLPGY